MVTLQKRLVAQNRCPIRDQDVTYSISAKFRQILGNASVWSTAYVQ